MYCCAIMGTSPLEPPLLFFLQYTPLLDHVHPSEFYFASFPLLLFLHGLWVPTVESEDGSYSACLGGHCWASG